jgi:hypothetical protein
MASYHPVPEFGKARHNRTDGYAGTSDLMHPNKGEKGSI